MLLVFTVDVVEKTIPPKEQTIFYVMRPNQTPGAKGALWFHNRSVYAPVSKCIYGYTWRGIGKTRCQLPVHNQLRRCDSEGEPSRGNCYEWRSALIA